MQEMEAIEALARVDVLCLDKTGTITTGELTVDEVIPFGVDKEMIHDIMGTLVYAFTETNATSTALQAFFKETDTYSVTDSVPFSSRRKFMGIQTKDKCFLLGAPDYLTKDDEILKKQPLTPMKDFVYCCLVRAKNYTRMQKKSRNSPHFLLLYSLTA